MKRYRVWIEQFREIKNHQFMRRILFLVIGCILFIAMFSNVQPQKLDISLFTKAEEDILSPVTIEDTEASNQKREDALENVEDQYILKTEYAEDRVNIVSALFKAVQDTKTEGESERETTGVTTDKASILMEKIPEDIKEQLTLSVFLPLLNSSEEQFDTAKYTTITTVRQTMKQKIQVGEEEDIKLEVANEINKVNLSSELRNSMVKIAQYAIIPNYVFDQQGTEDKRNQVLDELSPVIIRAGQVIVKEGQIVDREMYRQLELTGLLDEETDITRFIGLAFFVILLISLIDYFFKDFNPSVRNKNAYLLIFSIVLTLSIILMKVLSLFQHFYTEIGLLMPMAMATMLVKMLINERIAIIMSVILAFCGSLIFNSGVTGNFNFVIGLYFFFSSIAGIIFLSNQNHRNKILKVGLGVSLVNILVMLTLTLLNNSQYSTFEVGFYILLAVLSGINSSVLTLGLMPLFEAGFGILSTMKLIELSNPNHPLLRKLLTETPGTYHHSIMVANLAEAACEAIGADGFLARVGAYYHDLGKTKRPHFFIENQMNTENPHDNIAPQLSKTIITSHTLDGAALLKEHKMPKEIIDIAKEHHGTTLLKYFYHKAKKLDNNITEEEFRYAGPKPQTKESAIIGVADSVEAAVRSMRNPTPGKIESLVRSIISDRLQDGQFDECDITIKELDIAAKSMCETLKGIFHTRIEYPEIVKEKVKQA